MRAVRAGHAVLTIGLVTMLAGCSKASSWQRPVAQMKPELRPGGPPAERPSTELAPADLSFGELSTDEPPLPPEEDDRSAPVLTPLPVTACGYAHWAWDNPTPSGERFSGIWGSSARDIWATTVTGEVHHFDGVSWRCVQQLSGPVHSLAGCSATDLWAVGPAGAVYRYDGRGWSAMTSGTTEDLKRVFCIKSGDVWFIGAPQSTTLYHSMGGPLRARRPAVADLSFVEYSALWGTGPTDVWLVGRKRLKNLIAHYNGSRWTVMDGGAGEGLVGVRGTGASDIWAVGPASLVHFDGRSWRPAFDPSTLHRTHNLSDVWPSASNDVWLAGAELFHSDGKALTLVDGVKGSVNWQGVHLWAADASDVWLAGSGLDHRVGGHDGSAWVAERNGPGVTIHQIWGSSASDLWAVATGDDAWRGDDYMALLHFDGTRWSEGPIPKASKGKLSRLRSIWGSGPRDIWMSAETKDGDSLSGNLFHFDGTAWTEILPTQGSEHPSYSRLWGRGPADVWMMGSDSGQKHGLIKHFDGITWQTWSIKTSIVTGIYSPRAGEAWAAIASSDPEVLRGLLHFDGKAWTPVKGFTEHYVYRLWGTAANDIWALAEDGQVLHYNGKTWRESGPRDYLYNDIWASGPRDVWLVTLNGRVAHYDGTWHDLPVHPSLNTVFGLGPGQVWIGGYSGAVLRYRP